MTASWASCGDADDALQLRRRVFELVKRVAEVGDRVGGRVPTSPRPRRRPPRAGRMVWRVAPKPNADAASVCFGCAVARVDDSSASCAAAAHRQVHRRGARGSR